MVPSCTYTRLLWSFLLRLAVSTFPQLRTVSRRHVIEMVRSTFGRPGPEQLTVLLSFDQMLHHMSYSKNKIPFSFFVRSVNGIARPEKSFTKRRKSCTSPINPRSSVTLVGSAQFLITSIYAGSTRIPCFRTSNPKNSTSSWKKLHFLGDIYN